jgi:outer membrane lipoprotein LolB
MRTVASDAPAAQRPAQRAWRLRRLATVVVACALGGCAVQPTRSTSDAVVGRLSVLVAATGNEPARAFSAGFELRGDPAAGRLDLFAPTGTVVARAMWQPGSAQLEAGQGSAQFADLGELTLRALGERLPIEALFDWLQGRPWAGVPHAPRPQGFAQEGWEVDISALARGSIVARRDSRPAVTLRVRMTPDP